MKRRKNYTTDPFGRSNEWQDEEREQKWCRDRAYDRYFAGYEICEVALGIGHGTKRVRVYTGDVYRQNLPESKCRQLRLIFLLLFLASAGFMVGSLFLNVQSNFSVVILFCLLIPAVCYIRLCLVLMSYLPSGRNLKIREYWEGAARLVNACRMTCGAIIFVMVATLALFVVDRGSFSGLELVRLGIMAAAAAALAAIARLESKIEYVKVEGKTPVDPESEN